MLETAGREWELSVEDVGKMVKRAKSDMADLTDSQIEFLIYKGDSPVLRLKGKGSRKTFVGIVNYLTKVWDSYQLWRKSES